MPIFVHTYSKYPFMCEFPLLWTSRKIKEQQKCRDSGEKINAAIIAPGDETTGHCKTLWMGSWVCAKIFLFQTFSISQYFLLGLFCNETVTTTSFMVIRDSGIFQNTKVITILRPTLILSQVGDISEPCLDILIWAYLDAAWLYFSFWL